MTRVFVSGIGALSATGANVDEMWDALEDQTFFWTTI